MDTIRINVGNTISFLYTNWKGEVGIRKALVKGFYYGSTEYHQEKQMLMQAMDLVKGEERIFAVKDMSKISINSY